MYASWRLRSPRDNVWNHLYRKNMKTTSQAKEKSMTHYNLVHKFVPMPQAMKIPDAMDMCHLKNAELEPKLKMCKGRVVLRGDIVKTTLEPMQFLLNRARLRPKWLPQSNGCYCKITSPRTLRRTLPDCSEFQSQNVQTSGYVFDDTSGLNHGQTLKI